MGEFLNELRDLTGEGVSVPRVFIKGRYIGGVDEVVELNESGRLGRILVWARVERVEGRQACEGCGDARFVPCLECGGICKVLVDGVKERCGKCIENGLVRCPTCH
jgi:glutaredoxin domain-containing cysteine-rich protein 1